MTVSKPIIREIKDNEKALAELEKVILPNESEKVQKIIQNFPTVYIHNWPESGQYEVYVGETNNIFNRTREYYHNRIKDEMWQAKLLGRDASLYIIGHDHFNKSLTLDVENRLMHYLMSVDSVRQVHNGRGNPQGNYYPSDEFDDIFRKIWKELHLKNEKLFPNESVIKDSAIYKASPLHKLTKGQEEAKARVIDCIEMAMQKSEKQIIFVDGEAGTGKTVLNSSSFYELYCRQEKRGNTDFKCYMVVNHNEQVKVYTDICKKLGITEKYGQVVSKASAFLHKHTENDSVDVVFIDEAHLLFTRGNQGYSGKNQLDDIVKKAKVVVIVFDENQILRMDQYWESKMIDHYRGESIRQNNHIRLTEQLRMQADKETLDWIDSFTKEQVIHKIPHGHYEIKVFDTPMELELAINKKAKREKTKLSRLIANYDWDYKEGKHLEGRVHKYWEVSIGKWHKPWNYELEKEVKKNMSRDQKKTLKGQAWAEQAHTIGEVGSTYTIQGFDLNYAGIILGNSIQYRNGKIIYVPENSSNDKAKQRKTMGDGTMQNFGERLLKNEVRVLMTRGVNGMYIYACDDELREALKRAER
ncbi:DUF2075 domain-containing protein [uncultured Eubacterium sp.]|uniref:DUF2075 domain-containing protein n=1 Tax=uncultured Eubacterium sp. TaxID=165185 RepID=UPI0025FF28E9|nr:DUF2075 domain-containing protein [uncultured Eubacterium sp.]